MNYLANYFVRFLPSAKCLLCNEPLVTDIKGKDKQGLMPERAFCGHWFHYKCIEEFVNTPQFKKECVHEGCTSFLASKNFPCDEKSVKSREKRWVQE